MYIKRTENKYGTGTSHHVCDTCGVEFTINPAVDSDSSSFDNCLDERCNSYDSNRDADVLFMSDNEIRREKNIVGIEMLRKRKNHD